MGKDGDNGEKWGENGGGFCESTGTQLLTYFCVHLPVNFIGSFV